MAEEGLGLIAKKKLTLLRTAKDFGVLIWELGVFWKFKIIIFSLGFIASLGEWKMTSNDGKYIGKWLHDIITDIKERWVCGVCCQRKWEKKD